MKISQCSQPIDDLPPPKPECLLGAHFSIAKGLSHAIYEAHSLGCNTLQIFTKSSQTWKERRLHPEEIYLFKKALRETGIRHVASHMPYLVNLASPDAKKHQLSCHALEQELLRAGLLGIRYIVLHPGAHMGKGVAAGLSKIAQSINRVFENTADRHPKLLLETMAGQGSTLGSSFEQLSSIMDGMTRPHRIGFCLDSCHIFAAGYDIRTAKGYSQTLKHFDTVIGLQHLNLIHLNDSQKDFNSQVDRHAHIAEGCIGEHAFCLFMRDPRLAHIPKIIETPKEKNSIPMDRINLNRLRAMVN
jgi:deoxyribonuclease-4